MKPLHVLLLLMAGTTPLWAQPSFNDGLLKDGEDAMAQQDWSKAYRYLEIAAFGFMDNADRYALTQMLMALSATEMKDKALTESHLAMVRRFMPDGIKRPEGMQTDHWERFQVLAGLKAPPPPPLPKDIASLKKYVQANPAVESGWVALLTSMSTESSASDTRGRIAEARKAFPTSQSILGIALAFTINKDRGRDAVSHAKALLALNPGSALANEVLGNQAVKDQDYAKATAYYEKVAKPEISETAKLQAKLKAALEEVARKEEEARKAAVRKQEDARKQADLLKQKAALDAQKAAEKQTPPKKAIEEPKVKPKATVKDPKTPTKDTKTDAVETASKSSGPKNLTVPPKTPETRSKPKPAPVQQTVRVDPLGKPEASAAKAEKERIEALIVEARTQANLKPKDAYAQFHLLGVFLDHGRLDEAENLMNRLGKSELGQTVTYAGFFAQFKYLMKDYKTNINTLATRKSIDERGRVYLGLSYLARNKYREAKGTLAGIDRAQWPVLKGADEILNKKLK